MPLDPAKLGDDLEAIGPQGSIAAAAASWATAVGGYAASVFPASTTVAAAKGALETALNAAFGKALAAPDMEIAFTAFGTLVGGGMTGAGFAGVGPVAEVGFATFFAAGPRDSAEAAANALAALIQAWMITGTATLIAPPNTVVPWS